MTSDAEPEKPNPPPAAERPEQANLPRWRSEDLLQGQKQAVIIHQGVEYFLRVTRQGKLLLYK